MNEYLKAKMPDYGDGPEPCEDCVIKDKRIAELEEQNTTLRVDRIALEVMKTFNNTRIKDLEAVLKIVIAQDAEWGDVDQVTIRMCNAVLGSEGGADELISPKGIVTSKKAYERFHAEGGGDDS